MRKTCPVCGRIFYAISRNIKTCSRRCGYKLPRKDRKLRTDIDLPTGKRIRRRRD